jgi:nitrogen fixation NifU-like protein
MDLADLYRDVIVDHNKRPRNFGRLAQPNRSAEGNNPLCGDKLYLFLDVEDDIIRDIRFEGSGCAISTASASLMSEAVKGRRLAEVRHLFAEMHDMLTRHDAPVPADLGKLAALSGVREYPARVKCASLCWHTLNAALANQSAPVTTE